MNRLSSEDRARIVSMLVEGNGIRATGRACGVSVNTIQKLIRELGPACRALHAQRIVGLTCGRIQADEAWSFCYAREKNVPPSKRGKLGFGDVWTWTAVDADTKIVPAWHVGRRSVDDASMLYLMLNRAVPGKFELNTDGLGSYWAALGVLNQMPDYARIIKKYATPSGIWDSRENKYKSPALVSVTRQQVCGAPDTPTASTSYVERMNLGLRMSIGKLARLSNKHAKRIEMLDHSVSIYYMHYNLCRPHQTLKGQTPAQENGLTDHRWTVEEMIEAAFRAATAK